MISTNPARATFVAYTFRRTQSDKTPFQRSFSEQGRADAARQQFAQHKSDHLAIVDAFSAWRNKVRGCLGCDHRLSAIYSRSSAPFHCSLL